MSLQAAEAKLADVRRRLAVRRQALDARWQDAQSAAFAQEVLEPLDHELRRAINAMAEIAPTLHRARRETDLPNG